MFIINWCEGLVPPQVAIFTSLVGAFGHRKFQFFLNNGEKKHSGRGDEKIWEKRPGDKSTIAKKIWQSLLVKKKQGETWKKPPLDPKMP